MPRNRKSAFKKSGRRRLSALRQRFVTARSLLRLYRQFCGCQRSVTAVLPLKRSAAAVLQGIPEQNPRTASCPAKDTYACDGRDKPYSERRSRKGRRAPGVSVQTLFPPAFWAGSSPPARCRRPPAEPPANCSPRPAPRRAQTGKGRPETPQRLRFSSVVFPARGYSGEQTAS